QFPIQHGSCGVVDHVLQRRRSLGVACDLDGRHTCVADGVAPPSGEEADMASAHGQRGGRIGIIGALCLVDAPGSRAGDRITAVQDPQDPAMSLGFEAAQVLLGHSGQSARLIAGSGIDLGEALTASAGAVLIEEISDIHQAHADLIRSRCGGIAAAATNLHRSSAGGQVHIDCLTHHRIGGQAAGPVRSAVIAADNQSAEGAGFALLGLCLPLQILHSCNPVLDGLGDTAVRLDADIHHRPA
ncbi:MgtC/SapB family protein, partial [Dysosmobacter welbionis]